MAALDARLDGLMRVVKLSGLIEREGGWGATASWGDTLSLGARPVPISTRIGSCTAMSSQHLRLQSTCLQLRVNRCRDCWQHQAAAHFADT